MFGKKNTHTHTPITDPASVTRPTDSLNIDHRRYKFHYSPANDSQHALKTTLFSRTGRRNNVKYAFTGINSSLSNGSRAHTSPIKTNGSLQILFLLPKTNKKLKTFWNLFDKNDDRSLTRDGNRPFSMFARSIYRVTQSVSF